MNVYSLFVTRNINDLLTCHWLMYTHLFGEDISLV